MAAAAERGVAVPDHEDYDTWRNVIDFAVGRCEDSWTIRRDTASTFDYIAHTQESLDSALARVRGVLDGDDRHLAVTLAGQHEGEDIQMREERVARLLDDPETLRELRQQRAEARPKGSSRARVDIKASA